VSSSSRHLAVVVPDLGDAEEYYASTLGIALVRRETVLPDGLWYALRPHKGWADARAEDIKPGMVALKKGAVGPAVEREDMARIRASLPAEAAGSAPRPDYLQFQDLYHITWQITVPGNTFRTSGEVTGRWLEL
jgi:catechol 2,3-dioxygenase-like lactoylglutathione lyase family enzyme